MYRKNLTRVIWSIAIVFLWVGFVTDSAHAIFTDAVSLTGNVISTGSADLLISNSQNPSSTVFEDSRPGFSQMLSPGQTTEKYFLLKNASAADVSFGIDLQATNATGSANLRSAVNLEIIPIDGDGLPQGEGIAGTLNDLAQQHSRIFTSIGHGVTQRFKIRTGLSNGYADQNQSLTYDLVFTGTQLVSQ